jgi:hypothetical protein
MGMVSPNNLTVLEQPVTEPPFPSLIESATLEFHAALQLLAERARFLTAAEGVAIAFGEGRHFVYSASVGSLVPPIDEVANAAAGIIGEAISKSQPVFGSAQQSLIVPIKRQQKMAGYLELVSSRASFGQHELESVVRLADMAATALEMREGAEQAESRIRPAPQEKVARAERHLWHAPENSPKQTVAEAATAPIETDVLADKCWWCGFPISPGRKLCVDCEEKNLASISHDEKPMFEMEKQESWISAHGYTIATILVSALAAVVIYFLR